MHERYERVGFIQRVLSWVFMPLFACPKIGKFLFVKHSRMGRSIRRFASEYKSLEIIYDYSRKQTKSRGLIERTLTHALLNFINAKGVRNRLVLVEEKIQGIINSVGELEVVSLGAGSGRDIIDVLSRQNRNGHKAVLIDRSRAAISLSRKLARDAGVADNFLWIRGMVEEFIQNGKKMSPNLVVMVGFLDYPSDSEAIRIFKEIYRILRPGGYFITSNITNNPERGFLHRVLDWPAMRYRDSDRLSSMLQQGGFCNLEIMSEPLGVHLVAIAQKTDDP